MGANLSNPFIPDTSKDVIGAGDRFAEEFLGVAWALAIYAMVMIFSTCALVDRWRGPNGTRSVTAISVMAAFLLSTAWPVVLVYLMLSHP
jgi:hypothetical protein